MLKKKPSTPERVPTGLLVFQGSLDAVYGPRLLPRLLDLPGFDRKAEVSEYVNVLVPAVDAAVVALMAAKQAARDHADELFLECLRRWPIRDVQKATGYTDR
jgi:hypothetical protein